MKRVLFVDIENSSRSRMAEAFAHIYGGGQVGRWPGRSAERWFQALWADQPQGDPLYVRTGLPPDEAEL